MRPISRPIANDGIGRWNEADFVTALWKGTSPQGQHYYPAFPYTSYQRIALDDARDLFAYLQTLPAVAGKAPPHQVPFPFELAASARWMEIPVSRRPAVSTRSVEIGAVEPWCLSGQRPRALRRVPQPAQYLGRDRAGKRFAGGPDIEGKGWVPNITQKGLADYSEKDIAYLLETGQTPDGDSVGGAMTAVIRNTSQLPAADREAMAVYLKSLAPVEGPPRPQKK